MDVREIRHFHLFCGLGGGAKGFNKASPRVGKMVGKFRCIGGIDVSAPAIRDFERLAGVRGTVLDLFNRDQFRDFHGMEPPREWREATPADIQRAAGNERPQIVFLSSPCKGFSGLLSETRSHTAKYQALNRLTLRGVWLMLEAFSDEPPELVVFENVPRIASRGRHLLDQIGELLRAYGYAVAETTHDCGELGGLAQSRKRFLLVARHIEKVPPFLYEPEKKRLQAVGTVLDRMPLPGASAGGPMHRVPSLQWKTWVRLAFVEAGSDWRSLNRLRVEDGKLADYLIMPERRSDYLGVTAWDQHSGAISGRGSPTNGRYAVADPRFPAGGEYGQLGVRDWNESTGTVTGQWSPIQGGFSVADPRMPTSDARHSNMFRVIKWGQECKTITGIQQIGSGAAAVADPRHAGPEKHSNEFRIIAWDRAAQAVTSAHGTGQCVADPRGGEDPDALHGKYPVTPWDSPVRAVIAGNANGAYAVADPRPNLDRKKGDHYLTAGHYGVVTWSSPSGAVSSAAGHDNGRWSIADPRASTFPSGNDVLPTADKKLIAHITAEDGTWHRPFTTLELAALQSLVDPEEYLELDGLSDSDWRERIGNAVPPDAATAIAGVMGMTLLLSWSGETFALGNTPIWVQPVAIALSVAQRVD